MRTMAVFIQHKGSFLGFSKSDSSFSYFVCLVVLMLLLLKSVEAESCQNSIPGGFHDFFLSSSSMSGSFSSVIYQG